jgi:transcriptional regulator with XRE-family HTH domain
MGVVGEEVRRNRLRAGLSQSDLAGDEFSASYVSLIESGKRHPSDDALSAFARKLGCSVDDLRGQAEDDAAPVELELSYVRLTLTNGEPEAARVRLESVLARSGLGLAHRHEALILLARTHEKTNDLEAAIRVLKPVYDLSVQGRSPLPITVVAHRMCWYCVSSGDFSTAVRVGEEGLAACVDAGLVGTAEHLRLLATVMGAYLELGDTTVALAVADDLIRLAREARSSFGEAAAYWNSALVAESKGRLHEALRLSQRALALMGEDGLSRNLARLESTAAELLLRADPERAWQAASLLDRSRPALEDLGSPADLGVWEGTRALAHLLTGDAKSAEWLARRSRIHLADAGDIQGSAQFMITLGDSLVAQGKSDAGLAVYREVVDLLGTDHPGWRTAAMYRSLAYRFSLGGDNDGAMACMGAALQARGVGADTAAADVAFGRREPSPAPTAASEPARGEAVRAEDAGAVPGLAAIVESQVTTSRGAGTSA